MASRRLDIIIFGATGYTGNFIIEEVAKISKMRNTTLTFGIAGRSEQKLKDSLLKISAKLTLVKLPKDIPIIIADVHDEKSLREMAKKAKVIINACGPFWLLGEPVVKACIEEGTHLVDVSIEPAFIELIDLKYHEAAKKKNIYIVSACGVESVPADLGILFLEANFTGTLNSVEIYEHCQIENKERKGHLMNITTLRSIIHYFANVLKYLSIHSKLFANKLPDFEPKLNRKFLPHYMPHIKKLCVPIPAPDLSSIDRSQRYFYEQKKKRPIQVKVYFVIETLWAILLFGIYTPIIFLLSQFEIGRNLLVKYPKYFSHGLIGDEEPSEETINQTDLTFTFFGEGWEENLTGLNIHYSKPTNKKIVGRIHCKNCYRSSGVCSALCAKVILTEKEKLPNKGGVYAPAAAFADTSLLNLLQGTEDITFSLVSKPTNLERE